MKSKSTTWLYLITGLFLIVSRTLQIVVLTEPDTAFLKQEFLSVNIIFAAIGVLGLAALFIVALNVCRFPYETPTNPVPRFIVSLVSGVLYAISGAITMIVFKNNVLLLLLSLLSAFVTLLFGFLCLSKNKIPKGLFLVLVVYWIYEFIISYLHYSTRPLRVRTVCETFAIALIVVFFLFLAKAKIGFKNKKSVKSFCPIGLVASLLCFVSLVPEFIATALGYSANVSASCVSQAALLAAGIFTAVVSFEGFKRKRVDSLNITPVEETENANQFECCDDNAATDDK